MTRSEALNDPWNEEFTNFLRQGNRVLKIGCSDARRLETIEAEVDGYPFAGIDTAALGIKEAEGMRLHFDLRVRASHDTGFSE